VACENARSRRDAGRVDPLHVLGGGQDVAELAREEIQLRAVELEMRQRRDCGDLFARESRSHSEC